MSRITAIAWSITGGAFLLYTVAVAATPLTRGHFEWLPFPEWLVFGAVMLIAIGAWIRLKEPKVDLPPVAPNRPTATARIAVPGVTDRGTLRARWNMTTGEHRVSWKSNGLEMGLLVPGKMGGFDVYDEDEAHLGWVQSVTAGMQVLEDSSRT